MDTDSFIIEIPDSVEGMSNFILNNKEHFDLSECENKNLPLSSSRRKEKKTMSKEEYDEYINYGVPEKFKSLLLLDQNNIHIQLRIINHLSKPKVSAKNLLESF